MLHRAWAGGQTFRQRFGSRSRRCIVTKITAVWWGYNGCSLLWLGEIWHTAKPARLLRDSGSGGAENMRTIP